jgi:hypothetical protein
MSRRSGQLLFRIDQLNTERVMVEESPPNVGPVVQDDVDKAVLGKHLFIRRYNGTLQSLR